MRCCSVLLVLLLFAAPPAQALRCGNRLVALGDVELQVRERCGEPFWVDRYIDTEVLGANAPVQYQKDVEVAVWYYNFGSRQFISQLVFRDGTLAAQASLGYGVDTLGSDCDANRNWVGLSVGELVAHCGEPAARRAASGYVVRRPAPGIERWRDLREEDWTYDFGANLRPRVMHLREGRVVGVDTLPR